MPRCRPRDAQVVNNSQYQPRFWALCDSGSASAASYLDWPHALAPRQFMTIWRLWAPALVASGLLVAVAAYDIELLAGDRSGRSLAGNPDTGPAAAASATQRPPVDYQQLATWPLFGTAQAPDDPNATAGAPDEPPVDLAALPESKLGLKLFGVVYARDGQRARAILGPHAGAQREYEVGEEIAPEAILKRVMKRRILVEHKGQLEVIALPEVFDGSAVPASLLGLPPEMMPPPGVIPAYEMEAPPPQLGPGEPGFPAEPGDDHSS